MVPEQLDEQGMHYKGCITRDAFTRDALQEANGLVSLEKGIATEIATGSVVQ